MRLLVHTCDIKRNTSVGTNGRKVPQTLYTGVGATFIPMPAATAARLNFSLSDSYDVYMDISTDVKRGDVLVYDGATYTVKAVQRHPGFGPVSHTRIMAEREVS